MKTEVRSQKSEVRSQKSEFIWKQITFCFLLSAIFCFSSCSIPNLEKPECTDARNAVREFYSFDYSSDTKFNQENLQLRKRFLTAGLFQTLSQQPDSATDYFTKSEEPPKAFRVGECKVVEPQNKTMLGVVLFWRDNEINRQKEVAVEAVKENNGWLINKVEAKESQFFFDAKAQGGNNTKLNQEWT
ncbi:MAG: hypothetical protein ACR2GD_10420 [Pyrinomonadaceae bacterium]